VEAERERERGGLAWCGAARWRGVGAAAARPLRARAACCRAIVENGGVGATRVDVADRWAGTLRGPGRQRMGAVWGSAVRRSARCGATRWRGVGVAAARPLCARATRCRATVENGGVSATRVNVADRWAGTLRGPGRQRLGAAWGSAVRRSARR
jgi:hypothetical protein